MKRVTYLDFQLRESESESSLNMSADFCVSLSHDVILENPFLHILYPIKSITEIGITSTVKQQDLIFNFVTEPRYHEIDITQKKLDRKEKFLNSLTHEISYKNIDEQIQKKPIQEKISQLQIYIEKTVSSDLPTGVWEREKFSSVKTSFSNRDLTK